MSEQAITVGVIVEKRKAASIWIDHLWVPVAVLPGLPEAPPLTLIDREDELERYYLGASALVLARNETAHYRDNLMSGAPKLWVAMREQPEDGTVALLTVTADPAEGEALTEAGANLVDVVPMVPEIAAFVAAFVDENHVEREFYKRKRDEAGRGEGRAGSRRAPGEAP
jgi:hypothetical protein